MTSSSFNDIRSPAGRADIAERARTELEPPVKLSIAERRKWDLIIQARSTKEWLVGIDLSLAAILAQQMAQLDREMVYLRKEGTVLTGPRGGAVPNPRIAVVTSLRSSVLRYESRLHFDVEAGNAADRKNAREAERFAQQRDQHADQDAELIQKLVTRQDDLIPRPHPKAVQ